ncbi:hypothetical protein WJX82_004191 [Trebouxia sp. C0006]
MHHALWPFGPTQVVQVPQAPAPTAAPSTFSNRTTLHSSLANVSTDTSCSVILQEETLLCEALPGYLADMSHCTAPPQASTWNLAGGLGCSNPHWDEWGACNATCGGGVSTRLVQCIHSSNGTVSEGSCVAPAPASNMSCNMDPCDFCQENICYGEGTCVGQACQCDPGYVGSYCQAAATCSSGVVDAQQQCCPSGVLDNNVTCCELGSALDGAGWCCPEGTLDSCGVCNGAGTAVDVEGSCCKSTIDAAGVCCQDATVDECGVCGGLSSSCAILVQAQLQLTPATLQGNASARVAQGFATMLQTPASAIASITLASSSQHGKGTCLNSQGVCGCFPGYEGVACQACMSGWVPSQGYCVPYAPLLYTPQLWTKHVAALTASALAPAPAVLPRSGLEQGLAPGPDSLLNQENATMPGPESQLGDSFAEIESAQAEAAAPVPALVPLNGTPANASTSNLSPPLPVSRGPAAAPSAAVSMPPGLGGLADAAAATLGSTGSHVLLLSVTTVGGFCFIVLLAAAAVFCALRRRRNKRKAYVVERKPSESQASFGGSGRGAVVQPSPHKTTPKGLRQAYAKTAGLYRGESFSDENSNPNIRSWSVDSGHPTHPWGSPLQPTPLGQKLTGNQLRGSWPFMSLSPMLQDEEEDQKENMQIRSHSVGAKSILGPRSLNVESAVGQYHPGSSIFASFQSQSESRGSRDTWHSGQSASAWLQPTFQEDVVDAEDVLLHEGGADQQAAHAARKPLSVTLPQAPAEPTADAPTPMSSIGGGMLQGAPLADAGPTRDTALFYNGLFKSSFSQRGMQASGQSHDLGREQSFEVEPASAGSGSDLDISCLVDNTPFKINERGDFVAREPSSVGMKGPTAQSGKDIRPSSSRLQHPTGAGPASSRAGHFSSQPGQSGEAVHSGGPGLFGTSGQSSVHQASSSRDSGSSHDTEQSSSSSTGRLHVRAGQSPAALHLRESISGLLTSEQLPSQRESNREPSATEERAQFAGFGVNAQGHGLRPTPFQSHLERLSIPVSESLSEPVSDAPSPAARKQIRYVPAPPSPLQRASAATSAPSLLPTRQIPSPPQHQYVPMPLTNFATVSSPGASVGLQSLNGSRGALFNRARSLTPLGSSPSVTGATPSPIAEAPRDAAPDELGQNPHLSPSSNADSLSSPESMSQYDSTHQREDLAASLARESCTSAQSDASRQEHKESGMTQQQKPTIVFSRVLQELRGQQRGQTSSQGQGLGTQQGGNMFASSIRRGPLAGSAVARNPANGRQPGLLHYPAVKQPGSIATSPASSGIGRLGLTAEGSTRALAVGSPLIPAPAELKRHQITEMQY